MGKAKLWMLTGGCVAALTTPVAQAEDVGAIVAALNDPQAECRYLAQKLTVQNAAITTVRETSAIFIKSAREALKLPKGEKQKEQLKIVEAIKNTNDTAGNLSLRAQSEVKTVESVIKARRGSLDQCQDEIKKVPPPKEVPVPPEQPN